MSRVSLSGSANYSMAQLGVKESLQAESVYKYSNIAWSRFVNARTDDKKMMALHDFIESCLRLQDVYIADGMLLDNMFIKAQKRLELNALRYFLESKDQAINHKDLGYAKERLVRLITNFGMREHHVELYHLLLSYSK